MLPKAWIRIQNEGSSTKFSTDSTKFSTCERTYCILGREFEKNRVGLNLNIKSRNMLLVLNFSGVLTRPFHEHVAWPMAWPGMASGHHGLRPFSGSRISDAWPGLGLASGRRFRPPQAMVRPWPAAAHRH